MNIFYRIRPVAISLSATTLAIAATVGFLGFAVSGYLDKKITRPAISVPNPQGLEYLLEQIGNQGVNDISTSQYAIATATDGLMVEQFQIVQRVNKLEGKLDDLDIKITALRIGNSENKVDLLKEIDQKLYALKADFRGDLEAKDKPDNSVVIALIAAISSFLVAVIGGGVTFWLELKKLRLAQGVPPVLHR